jgi:hypothetical protein
MQVKERPDLKVAWFCLRTQPKHEHIAAAHLQQNQVEVFFSAHPFQANDKERTGLGDRSVISQLPVCAI